MVIMWRDKHSQTFLVGVMISVMLFIVAVIFIQPIKEVVEDARGPDLLDCTNSSISTGTRMTCILVDIYLFYFVGMVISLGLSYLLFRRLTGPY